MCFVDVDLAQPARHLSTTLHHKVQGESAEPRARVSDLELAAANCFCVNCATTGHATFHLTPLVGDLLRPSGVGTELLVIILQAPRVYLVVVYSRHSKGSSSRNTDCLIAPSLGRRLCSYVVRHSTVEV